MTEPILPAAWQSLIEEQRCAKIRQANALREAAKALEMEAATLAKIAKMDNRKDVGV